MNYKFTEEEKKVFSNRDLRMVLNLHSFGRRGTRIPISNSDIIMSVQSAALVEDPDSLNECIPVDFCDNI